MTIRLAGSRFVDEHGRTLILRGVNLGGSSKVPRQPDGATYLREGFFDHRNVSFVGRPFPLEEADEHFARLCAWGLTFLRFLVTWEAVEHAGPGIYDEAYLDYVRAVVERAAAHGLSLFVDPHQDMWSRFSGGDGAPGWTLEAAGFDLTRLHATGAAVTHQLYDGPLPRMIWPSNDSKLASATMFTLFFAGNDFAPATRVNGEPVQEYLQRHYIAAVCQLAERLKDLPNVVGYDTMNEPSPGYVGWPDLRLPGGLVKVGPHASPYQSMLLGEGHPQTVACWEVRPTGFKRTGTRTLNDDRARAWLAGQVCVWKQNGVWESGPDGEPRLLRPDYFARREGRPVDFAQDYFLPFARRFTEAIRAVDPRAVIFIESPPLMPPPRWESPNIVHAPHWYDAYVLFLKDYSDWLAVDSRTSKLVFMPWNIRRSFVDQLNDHVRESKALLNGAPTLIGEFGVAFDLQGKRSYRTGDFSAQVKALDRTFRALDDALLGGTLWNYTPDNTNLHGDLWNDEDLSIFSRDQQADPGDIHAGGRALQAVVRPYARAVAGQPLQMRFERGRRTFEFTFRHDPRLTAPTEFFIPAYQYPHGYTVTVSDGSVEQLEATQTLLYRHTLAQETHTVRVQAMARAKTGQAPKSFTRIEAVE